MNIDIYIYIYIYIKIFKQLLTVFVKHIFRAAASAGGLFNKGVGRLSKGGRKVVDRGPSGDGNRAFQRTF